ncbi:angiogenic factor with G patch and FHA domains 1 isoform X1 [Wyeomyia smithii]|uniref:angiogenic factor with G patch and FHA domains 1 isoform X1 n=1 Tax=Wyeomyia smithii TaxID=174621 RepID=UPI002467C68A|nr:angiogenic factor with G patch and FHA domains 1 isoform X1 [Wyeomyia smithii]
MAKGPLKIGTKLLRVTNLHDITVKEVYAYVKNLHQHIRRQNAKIRMLRRKLKNLRKSQRLKSANRLVQNDEDSEKENADDDVMEALERAEKQQEMEDKKTANAKPMDVKAFVDDIKKTAEDFDYQNRYIYEPTSGMYYDPATGYYYNAIYGLHYDGQRGCYLKYNEKNQQYEFYSQVMPEQTLEDKKPVLQQKKRKDEKPSDCTKRSRSNAREEKPKRLAHSRRRHSRSRSRSRSRSGSDNSRYPQKSSQRRRNRSQTPGEGGKRSGSSSDEDILPFFQFVRNTPKKKRNRRRGRGSDSGDRREEGELDSSSSESEPASVVLIGSSSASESDAAANEFPVKYSDRGKNYPPSLRLVVQKTNISALREGSLFIVTCKGGTLGREGDHDVIIPDLNVSKYHLKFSYNEKQSIYQVIDLGSRNGTVLNGSRMSGTMQESAPFDIEHGNVIQLNQTFLLCHIHDGNITCDACEPGLLVKGLGGRTGLGVRYDEDRITKPVSHKEGLKRLQKMYGLENEKYVESAESSSIDYKDRAAHRRKTKGSSNEHAKTQAASVDQHISSDNKGFKMLAKLGWSEGQSLGKNDEGLVEPIPLLTNIGTSGLGSQALAQPTASHSVDERKQMIWKMAQKRYESCAEVVDKNSSSGGNPASATASASLAQHIGAENKGFQLLSKLGWSAGETLGTNEDGLKEPIKLLTNVGTSGLGSKPLKDPSRVPVAPAKNKIIWKKRQKTCKMSDMFDVSDSD